MILSFMILQLFFFAHAVWANIQVTPNIQVLTGQLKYSERWIFFHRKVPLFPFSMLFFLQLIFFHFVHLVHLHTIQLLRWCYPGWLIWTLTPGFMGYIALYCVCNLLCFILQQLSQYCNTEPFFFNLKQAVCIVSLVGGGGWSTLETRGE